MSDLYKKALKKNWKMESKGHPRHRPPDWNEWIKVRRAKALEEEKTRAQPLERDDSQNEDTGAQPLEKNDSECDEKITTSEKNLIPKESKKKTWFKAHFAWHKKDKKEKVKTFDKDPVGAYVSSTDNALRPKDPKKKTMFKVPSLFKSKKVVEKAEKSSKFSIIREWTSKKRYQKSEEKPNEANQLDDAENDKKSDNLMAEKIDNLSAQTEFDNHTTVKSDVSLPEGQSRLSPQPIDETTDILLDYDYDEHLKYTESIKEEYKRFFALCREPYVPPEISEQSVTNINILGNESPLHNERENESITECSNLELTKLVEAQTKVVIPEVSLCDAEIKKCLRGVVGDIEWTENKFYRIAFKDRGPPVDLCDDEEADLFLALTSPSTGNENDIEEVDENFLKMLLHVEPIKENGQAEYHN